MSLKVVAAIAAGGALGSVLRYLMTAGVQAVAGRQFPAGTLSVNVLGSLAIGMLYVALVERSAADEGMRAFLIAGLLGGFTTFSSFSMETFGLMAQAAYGRALANVLLSVGLCLTATWLGVVLGRQL